MERKITLSEMQDIEFNILCAVAELCEKHNIRYGLAGGTLLGAVRHGGFIPWDDDIDIEMPRPDYIRFLNVCSELPVQYRAVTPYNDPEYFRPYAKVCDLTTRLIEFPFGKRIETHVYIDVFPIDGMPDAPVLQEWHRKRCMLSMYTFLAFRIARYKLRETRGLKKVFWEVFDSIQHFVIKDRLIRRVDRNCLKYDFDASKYCSEVIAGYGFKDTMPSIVYDFSGEVKFRERTFKTFRFPEYYLINIYGEYWKLPPEDKRLPHENEAYFIYD